MTVQEAINASGSTRWMLKRALDKSGTLDYQGNRDACDALEVLIRAAEENEGRKLAEKWAHYLVTCKGCPVISYCDRRPRKKAMCDYPDMHIDLWIEAAKKEVTP